MNDRKKVFRDGIRKLATKMREDNLSLAQIKKKGFVKKAYNYYNS